MPTVHGITERQAGRIQRGLEKIEAQVARAEAKGATDWQPILAQPLIGTEIYHTNLGKCNPLVGTGEQGEEVQRVIDDPQHSGLTVDSLGGLRAFDFLTRDLETEHLFVNLTGGIVTQDDVFALIRVTVPRSGSWTTPGGPLRPGGMWAAVSGVNHLHFGRTSGLVVAGGIGKALPLTETSAWDQNQMPVSLLIAHGFEDITSSQDIIYQRRGNDRLIIGAACEVQAEPVAGVPGYEQPSPADGATVVSTTPTLSWVGGAGVDDLFFGKPGQVIQIAQLLTADQFTFADSLEEDTTFEWLVRSQSPVSGEVRLSPLWSFTTGPNTPLQTNQWQARITMTAQLAGGAVPFEAVGLTARATMTSGLGGGRVNMQVSGTTWTASAVMQSTLTKF